MSKTTKAFAILGVAAGLGVAALPFNAMAATTPLNGDNDNPVTDQVTVKATLKDYISIELAAGDKGTFDETAATDITAGDPATVVAHAHTLDLGELVNGGAVVEGNLLVNVKTNNAKGYKLGIKAAGTNLVGKTDSNNTIAAGVPAVGSSLWSFKAEAGGTGGAYDDAANYKLVSAYTNYTANIPTTNEKIASYGKATNADGLNTKITFGVSADASQAADEYAQTVTFTAATDATMAF